MLFCYATAFAQTPADTVAAWQRCGTPAAPYAFDQWLQERRTYQPRQDDSLLWQIPVVVHIIHRGEAIGTGSNLSDERILSQIRVLNEDFGRHPNTNGFNTHPAGADTRIRFVLAQQDPQGEATSGIVRINGQRSLWRRQDWPTLSQLSYWNSEDYLNIWVCELDGFLGLASFPESDLGGLSAQAQNPLTDGLIINHRYFGITDSPPFNLGRTTTHEVGHYLGLRHTWGDLSNCDGSDFCDDTPPAFGPTTGCPTQGRTLCSTVPEMFENYMDYTHDACMRIFTQCQAQRMQTVLTHSPRRKTLRNSPGLSPPITDELDAGVGQIVSLQTNTCEQRIRPVVRLRNYSRIPLLRATLIVRIQGQELYRYTWVGQLNTLAQTTIELPFVDLPPGSYHIDISSTAPNGQADANPANDGIRQSFRIEAVQSLPFVANFEGAFPFDPPWEIRNPDVSLTWTPYPLPPIETLPSQAMQLPFFNYAARGQLDWLISPPLYLAGQGASLQFDYAYAPRNTGADELAVWLSTDCGSSFDTLLFSAKGHRLQTAPKQSGAWFPTAPGQWRRIRLDLSPWQHLPHLKIAFVGRNDLGNNLFLTQVRLTQPQNQSSHARIYPNPNSGFFYVGYHLYEAQTIKIHIFDTQGRVVAKYKFPEVLPETVNSLQLPAHLKGIYFVRVSGDHFEETHKILVH